MEKLYTFLIICSSLLFIAAASTNAANDSTKDQSNADAQKWIEKYLSQPKHKIANLRFYVQDALAGPNATIFEVARSNITSSSPTSFGQVRVLDDLITAGPDRNSMKLGRAQGLITSADLQVTGLAMNLNFVFTAGQYNGSVLCILGRNPIDSSNRELPVVGGSGVFRMARGFSISNTYSFDSVENYGVLEYNVYVLHV